MLSLFSRLKWTRKSKKTQNKEIKEEKHIVSSRTSESINSQTKAQTTSVYNNGRRFQAYKDCAYVLPNDDAGLISGFYYCIRLTTVLTLELCLFF
jgi:hypothetical protein